MSTFLPEAPPDVVPPRPACCNDCPDLVYHRVSLEQTAWRCSRNDVKRPSGSPALFALPADLKAPPPAWCPRPVAVVPPVKTPGQMTQDERFAASVAVMDALAGVAPPAPAPAKQPAPNEHPFDVLRRKRVADMQRAAAVADALHNTNNALQPLFGALENMERTSPSAVLGRPHWDLPADDTRACLERIKAAMQVLRAAHEDGVGGAALPAATLPAFSPMVAVSLIAEQQRMGELEAAMQELKAAAEEERVRREVAQGNTKLADLHIAKLEAELAGLLAECERYASVVAGMLTMVNEMRAEAETMHARLLAASKAAVMP